MTVVSYFIRLFFSKCIVFFICTSKNDTFKSDVNRLVVKRGSRNRTRDLRRSNRLHLPPRHRNRQISSYPSLCGNAVYLDSYDTRGKEKDDNNCINQSTKK